MCDERPVIVIANSSLHNYLRFFKITRDESSRSGDRVKNVEILTHRMNPGGFQDFYTSTESESEFTSATVSSVIQRGTSSANFFSRGSKFALSNRHHKSNICS